jgi:hypothetical protein
MSNEKRRPADDIVAAARSERRTAPTTASEAADLADKYEQMMRLAELFDDAGQRMREWAGVGGDVLADPAVTESAELSPKTYAEAEDEIRAATTGRSGLLDRSVELDADALVLRATVLTYQWIDDLQQAAYQTLGSIAGRAIGYLAPEVALGGAIVAAGLIETDTLDRDGVAAYLNELAEANPELMEHVTTGGGLLDSLQMRALLTSATLAGDSGDRAREGGLRAAGVAPLATGIDNALRDAAIGIAEQETGTTGTAATGAGARPEGLAGLMAGLVATSAPVRVEQVADGRYVAYLPGPHGASSGDGLQLVAGDTTGYADDVVRAISTPVDDAARVLLVGSGAGGAAAVEIAGRAELPGFVVEEVVTASSPSAQAPRLPGSVRVLSLEDRSDPVALLGSLINADAPNRLTVVFDAQDGDGAADEAPFVRGGRAADGADHPELVAEIRRLREAGYLA